MNSNETTLVCNEQKLNLILDLIHIGAKQLGRPALQVLAELERSIAAAAASGRELPALKMISSDDKVSNA